jgi:hypothetical protein
MRILMPVRKASDSIGGKIAALLDGRSGDVVQFKERN